MDFYEEDNGIKKEILLKNSLREPPFIKDARIFAP